MAIVNVDAGNVVGEVMSGLDALFTSDEERAAAKLAADRALQHPHLLQAIANVESARHPSLFVSGARPALLWLCVFCLGYAWIFRDLVVVVLAAAGNPAIVDALPVIDTADLMTLVLALLGLGGMRTYEGLKGVKRETLAAPTPMPGGLPATMPLTRPENGLESFLGALGVTTKPGVRLEGLDMPRMGPVLRAAAEIIPPPVVITSAVRPDAEGSFHKTGRALDFRSRHLEPGQIDQVLSGLRERLPSGYDVIHHDSGSGPHFHVEADRV